MHCGFINPIIMGFPKSDLKLVYGLITRNIREFFAKEKILLKIVLSIDYQKYHKVFCKITMTDQEYILSLLLDIDF